MTDGGRNFWVIMMNGKDLKKVWDPKTEYKGQFCQLHTTPFFM